MSSRPTLPDLATLDPQALRSLILTQHQALTVQEEKLQTQCAELQAKDEELAGRQAEITRLQLLIAKLQRMQFGRRSEKLAGQIEQLELQLDELVTAQASPPQAPPAPETAAPAGTRRKPARRPLPAHLPRQKRTLLPKETACPDCGAGLKPLGEDVSEILEYVPAHFQVIQQVRPKLACTHCDKIVQAPAPSRPMARSFAGAGLLAHVLVSKYCDHLPLYRQEQMYAREGVELDRATLADWVGGASQLLAPPGRGVAASRHRSGEVARRRHARAGSGPGLGEDPNRTLVDLCAG